VQAAKSTRQDRLLRAKSLRVTEVEPEVWRFVSGFLRDPEKIRAGMEKLIDEEQAIGRGDPERESKAWAEKLE
jgi:hypothetical protein